MIQAVSGVAAKQGGRRFVKVSRNYRTSYIGERTPQVEDKPEAFLIDMPPNNSILPHFHQVDQYQVFVAGDGSLGRNGVALIGLHYVDRHTAYGPINTGPLGLSFFTIRAQTDPGGIFLHKPGYKELLKPSKQRYLLAEHVGVSTALVLEQRNEVALEKVFKEDDSTDGLGAFMLRLGPNMKTLGPDPGITGGQYYLVVNGSLTLGDASYASWSTVFAGPNDAPLEVVAGAEGVEALILNFPRAAASS